MMTSLEIEGLLLMSRLNMNKYDTYLSLKINNDVLPFSIILKNLIAEIVTDITDIINATSEKSIDIHYNHLVNILIQSNIDTVFRLKCKLSDITCHFDHIKVEDDITLNIENNNIDTLCTLMEEITGKTISVELKTKAIQKNIINLTDILYQYVGKNIKIKLSYES